MATGALDANGIWQYGEDDSVSPWSPFMNLGQGSTSAAVGLLISAWTVYTPTLSSWGIGNGSITARYKKVGKTVHARGAITIGSTTTFAGSPTITLPIAPGALWSDQIPAGTCLLTDTSASLAYPGVAVPFASTTFAIRTPSAAFVNTTAPFTWTVGDGIGWSLVYEVA